ncbi:MAG: DUF11 domain-containing protein [Methanobrevibacter sp.]|uniref:COG1361 S-layer family protein n=1 Tax=Methanobrevibacter sp. TaxID=66852 RepID=UPI001B42BEDB|nr:DUF11 domain-containing protein [Methanobrevibacter sp.]MBP3791671.1 DUF11 domain-containing protein [Methanobrevibacter sp.]
MSLLIIFSVLICIGSVTAQDSSNATLTIDESSPTDISQVTIDDENDITEDVEGISESSANEQNSSKNLQNSVSLSKSGDMLGASNDNEVLTYTHTYDVEPETQIVKNELAKYESVSKGVKLEGKNNGHDYILVYYTPQYPVEGGSVLFIIEPHVKSGSGYSSAALRSGLHISSETPFEAASGNAYFYHTFSNIQPGTTDLYFHMTGGAEIPGAMEFTVYRKTTADLIISEHEITLPDSVDLSVNILDQNGNKVTHGTVSYFLSDGTPLFENRDVNDVIPWIPSDVGDYTVYAEYHGYVGDSIYYGGATTDSEDLRVKGPSSVTVGNDNIYYGSPASVDVTLVNSTGINAITITDSKGNAVPRSQYSVTGSGNKYTITVNNLAADTYTVSVTNTVNTNWYIPSSGVGTITVNLNPTTLTLEGGKTIYVDGSATLTPTVKDNNGNVITEGTVTYTYGTTTITQNVNDPLVFKDQPAGEYTINAVYNGVDGKYERSNSDSEDVKVIKYPTTTTVDLSESTIVLGESVVITPHAFNGTNEIHEGTFTLYDGENVIGTVNADGTYTYTPLNSGSLNIYAKYNENPTYYESSNNNGKTLKVLPTSQIEITANGEKSQVTVTYGTDVVIANVVTPSNANGTARLNKNGELEKDDFAVNSEVNLGKLTPGTYVFKATYDGNGELGPSESNEVTVIVKNAPSTVAANDTTVNYGDPISVNVTSTHADKIKYEIINGSGVVEEGYIKPGEKIDVKTKLDAGSYTVKLTTDPENYYDGATNESTLTVNKANSAVDIDDIVINHGEDVKAPATTENATGITYVVLKDGEPVKTGEVEGPGDNYEIIVKDLEPGNYTLKVTTKVDEVNYNDATKEVKITVKPVVDLEITKVVEGEVKVLVGDEITYTITVTNKGPSTATVIVVNDVVTGPATIDATKSVASVGSLSGNTWTIDKLDKDAKATLKLVVVANDIGTVKNTAVVKCSENETEKTANAPDVTVDPLVILDITKTVDKTVANVGDNVTYTITVKNNGLSDASDVKVTEKLSNLVKVVDFGGANYVNNVWTVGDLAKGASATLKLVVEVIDNGTVENSVFVNAKENETIKNATSDNVTANPVVDLEITKKLEGETTVLVGDEFTYVITVKNNGPSTATNVKVSEKLSELVKLVRDVEGYDGSVWTVGTLAKGQSKDLVLTVKVINNGIISNIVAVTSKENDTNKSNNNASAPDVEAKPLVILDITKTVDRTVANVGENVTYTITVKNNGLSDASDVKVTEKLSDLVKVVDVGGANYVNNVWTVGDLAKGATATLKLVVEVIDNGTVENIAFVNAKENETLKNATSDNVTAVPVVDVEVTKTVDKTVANVGEQITYTITVTNKGPSKATGVKVTEELSKLVKLVKDVEGYDGHVWTVGDLANGESKKLELVVEIINNGTVENFVAVTSTEEDTNKSNNNDTADNVTARPVVDLEITKVVNTTKANVGEQVKYTITVTNNGPSKATDVKVTEELSKLVELVGTVEGYDGHVWTVGDLAKGESKELELVVKIIANGTVENFVAVTSNENDTNKSNNNDTSDNVTAVPVVDLEITKVVNTTKANVGEKVTYTITVTNKGPSNATGVKVTEKLSDLVKVVDFGDADYDVGTNVWTVGDLVKGATATLKLVVEIINNGTVENVAVVNSTENDTNITNNNATSDNVTAVPVVDVEITKTVDKTAVLVGDNITYTITVTNKGPSTATDVKVSEKLSDLVKLAKDVEGYDGKIWNVGTLAKGESKTLTLVVTVLSNGTISNSVNVTSKENDTNKTNNNASAPDVKVNSLVILNITKVVDRTVANVGENVTYTITVTNNGLSNATGVKVTEKLSDLVKVVDFGDADYDVKTNVWTIGDLAKGATATLKLVVEIINNGTVENVAIANSNENDTDKNATSDNVTAVPVVDLEITKVVNTTKANVGEQITYTITVTNKGPSNATGVKVTEKLSDLVKVVDFGKADYDVKTNIWNIGSLNKGETVVLNLIVEIINNGTVENVAVVNSTENDTNITNNNATSDNVTAVPVVDVEVTKVVNVTTANVGEQIKYTITVTNNGPSNATGVKVTEELSKLVELTEPVEGYDGHVWSVGDLAKGESKELVLIVKIIANGTVENFVAVTSTENDTNKSNNNDTADNVTAVPVVDLEITKVVNTTKANVGEKVTYTITVTNKGPSNATGVKVTEKLSGLVKVVDYGTANYDVGTNVWTVGDLAKDATATLNLVVEIINNGTVENVAIVNSTENDTNITNNNATSDNVTAVPVVDVEVTKTVDKTVANVGEQITYTITVTNKGPSKATGVKVTEELSDLVKLVKDVEGYDGHVWTVGDLAKGESKKLELVVEIIANGTVENFVAVNSTENDTNKSNNNDTADNVTAVPVVDLEITKVVNTTKANVGEKVTYTITVTNKGPSNATGVKVTEKLSDLVKVVDYGKADYDVGTNVWTVGDLAKGATATLNLVVEIINNGTVENFVAVNSTENDTNKSNNNDTSDNVTAVPVVDLEITKVVNTTKANVGEQITYTITVTNKGPSKATGVKVTEELSELVELVGTVEGYDGHVWTVGDLANGESKKLELVVKIIANGTVENFVAVNSTENDTNKSNNNDTADNVTAVPVVDLEITKVVNVTTANVGEKVTYTITVTNKGPSNATGVKVTEKLSDLVKVMDYGNADYDVGTNVWTVGDLAKDATATLNLVVEIINNGTVENVAIVNSTENDTNITNNNDTADNVTAVPVVDLVITKTVDKTSVLVGDNVTYTITVTNKGPSTATDVKVAEKLSDLVKLAEKVDGYDGSVWTVGTLAKGETKTLKLVVTVISNGTIPNSVSVTSKENDTNKTNNNASAPDVDAKPLVILNITKTVDVKSANVGENVTYTITVTNNGLSDATGVKVTEKLSDLVKVVDFGDADYDVSINVWTVGNLAKGATATLKLVVEVINNGTVENSVFVNSNENDTDVNTTSDNVTAIPVVDLEITKTVDKTVVNVTDEITFTIVVKNNGPSKATGVKVTEELSKLVELTKHVEGYDGHVWTVGDLAKGESKELVLVVKVIGNGTIANAVIVASNENDTNKSNNNASSDNVTALPIVDLEITKVVDRTTANVGENVTYTITVTNKGPSDATDVKVTDVLSDLVKVIDFGDAEYDGGTNVWTVGDLAKDATATLKLVVEIINNGTVENVVSVSSAENDTNMSNNNATAENVTAIPVVDLEISKTVDKTTANVGDEITFTIVVKNNGPSKATGVKVTEELSKLVELTKPVEGYDGHVWTVGDLAKGESKELVLVVKVIADGIIENNVTVSGNENDTNKSNNNASSDNVTAVPVVDLVITKKVDKTTATVGDLIKFTITVTNNGPSDATGVKVTEKLSKLVKLQGTVKGYSGNVWNVGNLAKGETKTLELVVKVISAGTIENNVDVSANEKDTNVKNNHASSDKVKAKAKESVVKVKVKFLTKKGKLLKNQKVTFKYLGKTYTAKTNSKGIATIKVKKVGNKVNGVVKFNKVVFDEKVLKHKAIKFKYSIKFTNSKGKPYVGKTVVIKFKGKTYKVKTNKKGVASLSLKNLKKGKYNIVAYYKDTYYSTSLKIKK